MITLQIAKQLESVTKPYLRGILRFVGIGPLGIGRFKPPTDFNLARTSRSCTVLNFFGNFFKCFCNFRIETWP